MASNLHQPTPTDLRYSPAMLQHKLQLELHHYESLDEQLKNLDGTERTRDVMMSQQETVSLSQVLQVGNTFYFRASIFCVRNYFQLEGWSLLDLGSG